MDGNLLKTNITLSGQRNVAFLGLVFDILNPMSILDQVLDATKVKIGKPLPRTDVLWIAEQVPGELLREFTDSLATNTRPCIGNVVLFVKSK